MRGLHAEVDRLASRLSVLEARLDAARRRREAPGQMALDLTGASGGGGEPCGNSWIDPNKTCHKGAGGEGQKPLHPLFQETLRRRAEKAAAPPRSPRPRPTGVDPVITTGPDGAVLINGKPPAKTLGAGAFGDAFMAEADQGLIVVKVDRLSNGDPMETDPTVPKPEQRRRMVERERSNMQRAHDLGLAAQPLGPVQELSDGRLAFAYRMVPGVKLAEDHRSGNVTSEARAVLEQPGALGRYAVGISRIARTLADAGFDHGDLHPGNILIGADGTPSLVDWGYAKPAGQKRRGGPAEAAHEVASREMHTLIALGDGMVPVNRFPDRSSIPYGYDVSKHPFDSPVEIKGRALQAAGDAYRRVIDAYDDAWFDTNDVDDVGERLRTANRLVKEQGLTFDEAEREAGLRPKLPPNVIQEAEQARDALFGPAHLVAWRQKVDEHYRQWRHL